jgi:uncharacterized lipoprotein YmbA
MRTIILAAALALAACGGREPVPPTRYLFDGGPKRTVDCPEGLACRCWVEHVEVTNPGCFDGAELGAAVRCCFGDLE